LTHDLYVSPIEFDPGKAATDATVVDLHRGESSALGPFRIAFEGFDRSAGHAEGGQVAIGAILTVQTTSGSHRLVPVLALAGEGFEAVPVPLPGTSQGMVQLVRVDATAGVARLHIHGMVTKPAARASLTIGESLSYGDSVITLTGVDVAGGKVRATLQVAGSGAGSSEQTVVTELVTGEDGTHQHLDAAFPGMTHAVLRLDGADLSTRQAALSVFDPDAGVADGQPMRFAVDFSIKPMIGMLWLGLVILLAGAVLAVIRRGEEFSTAVEGP